MTHKQPDHVDMRKVKRGKVNASTHVHEYDEVRTTASACGLSDTQFRAASQGLPADFHRGRQAHALGDKEMSNLECATFKAEGTPLAQTHARQHVHSSRQEAEYNGLLAQAKSALKPVQT